MYKPSKTYSHNSSLKHAEEYANQTYSPARSYSKRSDYSTPEDYQTKTVKINPDSDKPDPEARVVLNHDR